jgi:hypothetical protein
MTFDPVVFGKVIALFDSPQEGEAVAAFHRVRSLLSKSQTRFVDGIARLNGSFIPPRTPGSQSREDNTHIANLEAQLERLAEKLTDAHAKLEQANARLQTLDADKRFYAARCRYCIYAIIFSAVPLFFEFWEIGLDGFPLANEYIVPVFRNCEIIVAITIGSVEAIKNLHKIPAPILRRVATSWRLTKRVLLAVVVICIAWGFVHSILK